MQVAYIKLRCKSAMSYDHQNHGKDKQAVNFKVATLKRITYEMR